MASRSSTADSPRAQPADERVPGAAPARSLQRHERATRQIHATYERLSTAFQSLSGRLPWLRHWEFWLALVIGAFLRLWQLGTSQFLDDQTLLMSMARTSVLEHAIPVTGIPASIGVLNPPLSVYLLIPFAAFGKDPFLAILALALWNVLGVALCYIFAWRYFNRTVAAIGTLLFATSGAAVEYSRFLWQQNYLPPLLILWALATFAGALRGTRGWFFASVSLLALAAVLHPTALLFLPVLLAACILAPRKPHLWEYAAVLVVLVVLAAPTIVWEKLNGYSDLRVLQHYTTVTPQVNLDVFSVMEQAFGPPAVAGSPYAAIAGWATALWYLACAIYGVSYLVVTGLVVAPILRCWRQRTPSPSVNPNGTSSVVTVWRTLRADTQWRVHLLLWLGVTCVPVALIRHSSPVHAHYLIVLYPLLFILAGVGLDRLTKWTHQGYKPLARLIGVSREGKVRLAVSALVVACVAILVAGQTLQSGLYTASRAAGQVDDATYGYPVGELESADTALAVLQRQQGAAQTYISAPAYATAKALTYMLVSERPDRALVYGNCLILPPSSSSPALVVSTSAESPMGSLLAQLPNARLVRTLPMPGNEPFQVYRVEGNTPPLPREQMLSGAIFQDGAGNTMRLDGLARANGTTLRLRWTVLRMAIPAGASRRFYVDARATSSGVSVGMRIAHAECDPTSWQTGATVFTWVSTAGVTPPTQPAPALPATVAVSAWDQVASYDMPTRHGLRLETSDLVYQSPNQLVAMKPHDASLPAGFTFSNGEMVFSDNP